MIVLESGDELGIYSGSVPSSPDLDVAVCWLDEGCAVRGTQVTRQTTDTGSDDVQILAGPTPPATWRAATWVSVANEGDGSNSVAIVFARGSEEYTLWRGTLAEAEVLVYDGGLWRVLGADGIVRVHTET